MSVDDFSHCRVVTDCASTMPASANVDRKQGLPQWLLWMTLEGGVVIRHKESEYLGKPGEIVIYEPGIRQTYGTFDRKDQWVVLWVVIHDDPEIRQLMPKNEIFPGIHSFSVEDPRIVKTLRGVEETLRSGDLYSTEFARLKFLESLLLCRQELKNKDVDERLTEAISIIHRMSHIPLSLDELARDVGLSPSHLSHLFKRHLKKSPVKFHEEVRMKRASELLRYSFNLRIADVAEMLGYDNPLYFSTRFKHHFGVSPRKYREEGGV